MKKIILILAVLLLTNCVNNFPIREKEDIDFIDNYEMEEVYNYLEKNNKNNFYKKRKVSKDFLYYLYLLLCNQEFLNHQEDECFKQVGVAPYQFSHIMKDLLLNKIDVNYLYFYALSMSLNDLTTFTDMQQLYVKEKQKIILHTKKKYVYTKDICMRVISHPKTNVKYFLKSYKKSLPTVFEKYINIDIDSLEED